MNGNLSYRVSVLIPMNDQSPQLDEAIESLQAQSVQSFEAIVVAASKDEGFFQNSKASTDSRFRMVASLNGKHFHSMLAKGMRQARGEFVTVMRPGERLHHSKLQEHLNFLDQHKDIGASVSGSIEFDERGGARSIRSVPPEIDLAILLPDLPFALSDIVVRKEWLINSGLANEKSTLLVEDLPAIMWLTLCGCRFAGLNSALTDRQSAGERPWSGTAIDRIQFAERAISEVFQDPRCGGQLKSYRNAVIGHRSAKLAIHALRDDQIPIGQHLLRNAIRHDHSLIEDQGRRLLTLLTLESLRAGTAHERMLENVINRLPEELLWVSRFGDWAVALGFFWLGIWSVLWGRIDEARDGFEHLMAANFRPDKSIMNDVLHCLLVHTEQVGHVQAEEKSRELVNWLEEFLSKSKIRQFSADYFVNVAFRSYKSGEQGEALKNIGRASLKRPSVLTNRGISALVVKSLLNSGKKSTASSPNFTLLSSA